MSNSGLCMNPGRSSSQRPSIMVRVPSRWFSQPQGIIFPLFSAKLIHGLRSEFNFNTQLVGHLLNRLRELALLFLGLELIARPGKPVVRCPAIFQLACIHDLCGRVQERHHHAGWFLGRLLLTQIEIRLARNNKKTSILMFTIASYSR